MKSLFIKAVIFTVLIVAPLIFINILSYLKIITLETKNLVLICVGILLAAFILIAVGLRKKKKMNTVDEPDKAE